MSELGRDHDRLVALHAELDGSRLAAGGAQQAELARLAEEREQTSRQVEALRVQLEELRSQREADERVHEQSIIALRQELEAARRPAEAVPPPAPSEPAPAAGAAEGRLAEVQSQLELAEASRSVLIDALKIAQKQVQDLTVDLNESVTEQRRIRSMLNNMGIHLL